MTRRELPRARELALLALLAACAEPAPSSPPPTEEPAPSCVAGEARPCYGGPEGTEGIGRCAAGRQICRPDGSGFGICHDEIRPRRERCGDAIDDDCDGSTTCGETRWLARWGSDRDDAVMAIAVDGDGDLYLGGYHRQPIDLGGGALPSINTSRDLFVAKIDGDGDHVFSLGIPSAQALTPRDLAVVDDLAIFVASVRDTIELPGVGLVPGAAGDDILILALTREGDIAWYRRLGGDGNDNPGAVTRGPGGEVLITGSHEGVLDLDGAVHDAGTDFDVFVAALDPVDGQVVWSRSFAGPHDQISRGIAADDAGIYVVGSFRGEVDFGAGLHASAGGDDAFILALTPDGQTTAWSQALGDTLDDLAYAVAIADGPVVVGRFRGTIDLGGPLTATGGAGFVARFDRAGALQMARVTVAAQDGGAYDVAVGADGRLVIAGYYDGLGDDGGDRLFDGGVRVPTIIVQKMTAAGDTVWSRTMTVHQNQTSQGAPRAYRRIALTPEGAIALGGYVRGSFYDTEPFGDADAFAALLEP